MAEHDLLIAASGRILSGFYLLARRPDLAKRIRLSLPRPKPESQNGDDSSGDDSPGNAPSDDEPTVPTDAEPAAGGPVTAQ